MGMGGNENKNVEIGNRHEVLDLEWVGMRMGIISWEWDKMGTIIVIPAHL